MDSLFSKVLKNTFFMGYSQWLLLIIIVNFAGGIYSRFKLISTSKNVLHLKDEKSWENKKNYANNVRFQISLLCDDFNITLYISFSCTITLIKVSLMSRFMHLLFLSSSFRGSYNVSENDDLSFLFTRRNCTVTHNCHGNNKKKHC